MCQYTDSPATKAARADYPIRLMGLIDADLSSGRRSPYFAGDFTSGAMDGVEVAGNMWLVAAAMMLIPILMVFLTLVLGYRVNRILNIGIAVLFFLFNLYGLPSYPGLYDRFLLGVSLIFNVITVWYA